MAEAERARRHAYAPYSRFAVGAALLTANGRVVHGCNVENASHGLSVCAERNAVWRAMSEGLRDFVALAVTAGAGHGAAPCGSCRQVLHELAPQARVMWQDAHGRILERRVSVLLPYPFDFPARARR
jgi:cytidine deaminase